MPNTSNSLLACSVKDRIAVLALTDPPKRNAMSLTLRKELMACLQKLDSLDEADAIIITGDGDKSF